MVHFPKNKGSRGGTGSMKISGLLLLLAAVFSASMAAPCRAETMRGEVFLDKDTITVADVFGPMGDKSNAAIGAAPAPGQQISYDVTALLQIARAFHLDWKPKSNYDRVTVTRASQKVTADMVRTAVQEMLVSMADENNKDLDVAMDNQGLVINKPTSTKMDYKIADLKLDPISHRFSGSLVVSAEGLPADVTAISGRAMPMIQVARLIESQSAGAVLGANDVEWVRVALDKTGADVISNAKQLEGTELRRNMGAQIVLHGRDLVKERLIQKGDLVDMQVKTENMLVSARGRALGDGAMGETIRVTNASSNRTIDAVVTGKGTVSVAPLDTPVVASR